MIRMKSNLGCELLHMLCFGELANDADLLPVFFNQRKKPFAFIDRLQLEF
jgi:hypothetical protein